MGSLTRRKECELELENPGLSLGDCPLNIWANRRGGGGQNHPQLRTTGLHKERDVEQRLEERRLLAGFLLLHKDDLRGHRRRKGCCWQLWGINVAPLTPLTVTSTARDHLHSCHLGSLGMGQRLALDQKLMPPSTT